MKLFHITLGALLAIAPFAANATIAKQTFNTTNVDTTVSATVEKTVSAPTVATATQKAEPAAYKLATNTYVDGAYEAATSYTRQAVQDALDSLASNASVNQTVQIDIANAIEDFLANNMSVATTFSLTGQEAATQLFEK